MQTPTNNHNLNKPARKTLHVQFLMRHRLRHYKLLTALGVAQLPFVCTEGGTNSKQHVLIEFLSYLLNRLSSWLPTRFVNPAFFPGGCRAVSRRQR